MVMVFLPNICADSGPRRNRGYRRDFRENGRAPIDSGFCEKAGEGFARCRIWHQIRQTYLGPTKRLRVSLEAQQVVFLQILRFLFSPFLRSPLRCGEVALSED